MASIRTAILLASLVLCASCTSFTPTPPVSERVEHRRGFPDGLAITTISIPEVLWALRCGEGEVLLVEGGFAGPKFWRIDPETTVVAPLPVSAEHAGNVFALGYGSLWSSGRGFQHARATERLNPTTLERLAVIPAKGQPVMGAESVWLIHELGGDIVRIDPRTNAITGTISTNQELSAAVESEGSLWVLGLFSGEALRIDPAACRITGTIRVGPELAKWYSVERMQGRQPWNHAYTGLAAGLGSLWVIDAGAQELIRVDPETGTVIGTPELVGSPICMRMWRGSLWVACDAGSRAVIHRIDAAGATIGTIDFPRSGGPLFEMDATDDALWFAQPNRAYRIRLETGT